MSMLNVDKSLLGFRYTKWHDCPASAVSNGRARALVHTYSETENVIYAYDWPMDAGKFKIHGGYLNGLQFRINPATPPVVNGQQWKTALKGFLENSAIHFHRFLKSENDFFPTGLEIEAYVYCLNHFLDLRPTWAPIFGAWIVENEEYHQTVTDIHAHSRAGESSWGNYSVESKVKLIDTLYGGAGVIARVSGAGNHGYALVLYPLILKLYDTDGWNVLGQVAVSADLDTWHKLKLEMNGTSIKGYLDDELEIDITDETYSQGKIDLFCSSTEAYFDDVKAIDTNDKLLLLDDFSSAGFRDLMIVFFHFKNAGESQINFKFGVYTADYSDYAGTEKYVHPDYSALVKSDDKTVIWGSDTTPQDCYMDGSWRTTNYSDATPNSNWLRWDLTIDAGDEKLLAFVVVYGDTEQLAVYNYGLIKALDHKELLQKDLRFWGTWLSEGKAYSSGIWEIDQLAKINLCLIKSFMSQDNSGTLPSSVGDGYPWNHWPCDAWTCYYALTLWNHLDEAKDYFGTYIKTVVQYIVDNALPLYRAIHILNLIDYTAPDPPSAYTAEDCFLLPIVAVETWKKDKSDTTFRDNIWSWIQTFMDEIDGDLITSGDWKDHFDHTNIVDTFESWIFVIPHDLYGNSSMVVMPINALLAHCYEEVADLAEAVGEYSNASTWRSRAKKILDKFYDFWTLNKKANYHYWGDVTGFGNTQKWPHWANMKHEPLPEKPIFRLSWLADIKDETMRRSASLYYNNYLAYYPGLIAAEPADNWMYGKTEKRSSYGTQTGFDMHLWDIFLAATHLGLDDVVEDFFLRLETKYSPARNGLFDEWPKWNGDASTGYHMVRTVGLFLIAFAFLFNRLDPIPVKRFQLQLHANGKEVTILKSTGTSTDQFGNVIPSFEPTYITEAIVESFRAGEQVVLAGYASVDDRGLFFRAFTPIDVGDRVRINDVDYAVQTVQNHHYRGRIVKKEVFAKRVVE